MPSFVDAADAAGAAQGSSALVVATGAAVAAGHDDFSVVVAAASSPSNSGTCKKRLRHTDFPNMSDTEYREICSADARSRRPRAIAAGSALCARTQRDKSSSGGVTSTALLRRGGCQHCLKPLQRHRKHWPRRHRSPAPGTAFGRSGCQRW